MPYEWVHPIDEALPNAPDFGDETELEIIIDAGQREAEEFSQIGAVRPAKWLNPPTKVVMAADYD